jgi:NAD+ diphosphatase
VKAFEWVSLQESMAPRTLGFAHGALDRAAQWRGQPEKISALEGLETTRFMAFCGENAVLRRGHDDAFSIWFEAADLPPASSNRECVFLGLDEESPRFATWLDASVEAALAQDGNHALMGVRQMALERPVSATDLGAVAEGRALTHWHQRHRFCSNCSAPTRLAQGGWRRDCPQCSAQHFPRTDPVVIMLTISGDRCLLGRQHRFVPNVYSTLAGFVEPGETIEDAVRRETFEEAGIRTGRVRIIANQPWPFPMSLMIGAFAEALSEEITRDEEELEDCRWFARDEVLAMIEKRHPAGLLIPPHMAIANHLIRHFLGLGDLP